MAGTDDDPAYLAGVRAELANWREAMLRPPTAWDRASKGVQTRINRVIPERVHIAVTAVVAALTRAILTGSHYTTGEVVTIGGLADRDEAARRRIEAYRATAAAEGGIAGAGGFLLAAADFPVLIGIKIKLLFDVAAIYGYSGARFDERLHILALFQLAFSSARHRAAVFGALENWDAHAAERPASADGVDWRTFQQEYRDYIDLAKMAQLLPVVGAPIGAFVNYRLLDQLGRMAMNGYRTRWLADRAAAVTPPPPP